jgi:dTDP-4-dehydrorhamnose 3,5-epimerase-like enzyme
MKKYPLYTLIDFHSSANKNGTLTMFDRKTVPFDIKRILTMHSMNENDIRGGHTHHITHQILICTKGQCVIDLDNGKEKKSITLSSPTQGIVLYPYVWHYMRNFKDDAILLVLASTDYDEKDYIRSYEDFLKFI